METALIKLEKELKFVLLKINYIFFKATRRFRKRLPNINNILIVELLPGIGDLITATPAFKALKKRFPDSKITIMINGKNKDVLNNSNYGEIITYKDFKTSLKEIKNKYDTAILLHPGSFKISLMLLLAKIPYRIGCSHPSGIFSRKGFFLHDKPKPVKLQHTILDYLDVVRLLGADTNKPKLEINVKEKEIEKIKKILRKYKVTDKDSVIIIHPFSAYPAKNWINKRFAEVADRLIENYEAKIIFTGSKNDSKEINKIIDLMENKSETLNLSGTSIRDFFSLIKISDLTISVDTSAMHVAAALNVPVIALFGAGNPRKWHPFSEKQIVIFKNDVCTSCMRRNCSKSKDCMDAITKRDVLEAVKTIKNEIK